MSEYYTDNVCVLMMLSLQFLLIAIIMENILNQA